MSEIPVRCFSCGKVVGNLWLRYTAHLKSGRNTTEALDAIGLTRSCCRSMLLGHVELCDPKLKFQAIEGHHEFGSGTMSMGAEDFDDDAMDED